MGVLYKNTLSRNLKVFNAPKTTMDTRIQPLFQVFKNIGTRKAKTFAGPFETGPKTAQEIDLETTARAHATLQSEKTSRQPEQDRQKDKRHL